MKRLALLLVLVSLLIAGVAQAAPAQQNTPTITEFSTTATVVDRAQLDQRAARVPVRWNVTNRPEGTNLVFEQVLPDGRVMNVELPRDNPFVASSGTGVVAPFPPGENISSIELRLRVFTIGQGRILAERTLSVPIGSADQNNPVSIRTWSSTAANVSRADLAAQTARVPVDFAVDNRPAGSNLIFQQVLPDGTVVNVELPRQDPIVPSSGRGIVAPRDPGSGATSITLRLLVAEIGSGRTLAQRDITLPIVERPVPVIRTFSTSATEVLRSALVGRTARLPVAFTVENRPPNSNLVFEQVLPNNQVVNIELPRNNPIIPSAGNGSVAPVDPGSAATSLALRLRVIDLTTQATLVQQDITIPINNNTTPASISTWSAAGNVNRAALLDRSARVTVNFAVNGRPANSNLIFEQVMPNGPVVNVELPRNNPIVPSQGTGVVAPLDPGATTSSITLPLRLIDLGSQATLAQQDITVPIVEAPAPVISNFVPTYQGNIPGAARGGLTNGTLRLPVTFAVDNRPNGSNLAFEQVLPGGQVVNIELPRQNPIIPSSGNGVVAPRDPGASATVVKLRLRVFSLSTGATLATRDFDVPIIEGPAASLNFTVNAQSVERTALAARTARLPVSWQVFNRPEESNLVFEQVLDDGTVVNIELPRQNPIIPSQGTGNVAPVLPGTASVITLRVRLVDRFSPAQYDVKEIQVPVVESPNAPRISLFTTTASAVRIADLRAGTTRIPVSWQVQNRPANSNLAFEQVLPNNVTRNIELPRQNPIVPTSGNGTVAPVDPGAGSAPLLFIRVRLFDITTNATIDLRDITVPITGVAVPTPTAAPPLTNPEMTPEATPEATLEPGATITSFTVNPTLTRRAQLVTFSWAVTNLPADGTVSLYRLAEDGGAQVEAVGSSLPASGTLEYQIPMDYVQVVPFALVVSQPSGYETQVLAVVSLECRFANTLTLDCPVSVATIPTSYQPFERGHMIWRGDTSEIYVLFEDGSWIVVEDTFSESDSDPVPAVPPGPGQVVPRFGFGKVWADLGGSSSPLGFATRDEFGARTEWEFHTESNIPYIRLPDGRLAKLTNPWSIQFVTSEPTN